MHGRFVVWKTGSDNICGIPGQKEDRAAFDVCVCYSISYAVQNMFWFQNMSNRCFVLFWLNHSSTTNRPQRFDNTAWV